MQPERLTPNVGRGQRDEQVLQQQPCAEPHRGHRQDQRRDRQGQRQGEENERGGEEQAQRGDETGPPASGHETAHEGVAGQHAHCRRHEQHPGRGRRVRHEQRLASHDEAVGNPQREIDVPAGRQRPQLPVDPPGLADGRPAGGPRSTGGEPEPGDGRTDKVETGADHQRLPGRHDDHQHTTDAVPEDLHAADKHVEHRPGEDVAAVRHDLSQQPPAHSAGHRVDQAQAEHDQQQTPDRHPWNGHSGRTRREEQRHRDERRPRRQPVRRGEQGGGTHDLGEGRAEEAQCGKQR
ncbi:hypothetical protein GCM10009779_43870 [Polymorphospora rubra]|uniref:Uncharacterized protein n=1 Tax=Polymorphospora rubra TaxID=338584 RepID=A0A810N8K9_9ACTN|nr:hypothetical protein Prubr_51490 [Polymorphospora rubra]